LNLKSNENSLAMNIPLYYCVSLRFWELSGQLWWRTTNTERTNINKVNSINLLTTECSSCYCWSWTHLNLYSKPLITKSSRVSRTSSMIWGHHVHLVSRTHGWSWSLIGRWCRSYYWTRHNKRFRVFLFFFFLYNLYKIL